MVQRCGLKWMAVERARAIAPAQRKPYRNTVKYGYTSHPNAYYSSSSKNLPPSKMAMAFKVYTKKDGRRVEVDWPKATLLLDQFIGPVVTSEPEIPKLSRLRSVIRSSRPILTGPIMSSRVAFRPVYPSPIFFVLTSIELGSYYPVFMIDSTPLVPTTTS